VEDAPRARGRREPERPEAPAEIDVLVVREVALVEAADAEEYFAIDEHRRSAGEERRARRALFGEFGCAAAVSVRRAMAVEVHRPAVELDHRPFSREDPRSDARRAGRGARGEQLAEPVG
jgi:hypothetical protein